MILSGERCFPCICALFIIDSFGYPGIYFRAIAGGIIGINVFLGLCMSLRPESSKSTIRNSAIYLCLLFLWKLLRWLFKGLGGLFRWLLSVCRDIPIDAENRADHFGICFIEFIVILFCWYETDVLLVFWIIGRLILIPAVLYAAITMINCRKQAWHLPEVIFHTERNKRACTGISNAIPKTSTAFQPGCRRRWSSV